MRWDTGTMIRGQRNNADLEQRRHIQQVSGAMASTPNFGSGIVMPGASPSSQRIASFANLPPSGGQPSWNSPVPQTPPPAWNDTPSTPGDPWIGAAPGGTSNPSFPPAAPSAGDASVAGSPGWWQAVMANVAEPRIAGGNEATYEQVAAAQAAAGADQWLSTPQQSAGAPQQHLGPPPASPTFRPAVPASPLPAIRRPTPPPIGFTG